MADNTLYPVEIPAEDAKQGISTGYEASRTAGILYGDGQGGIRTARPGEDYGYPLIQGNGPPGGSTVANLGQHYFDMAATKPPYEYICVGYTAFGFVWTVYGDTGAGFQVLGRFSSIEALEAAVAAGLVPKPSPGDAYFIGDVAPYNMYFWDIMTQNWAYYGPLGGAGGGSGDVTGIPPHGDTGQVLKKRSDVDYDVSWGEAVSDGAVTTAKIASGAVTTAKIASGAVTLAKLADEVINTQFVRMGTAHDIVPSDQQKKVVDEYANRNVQKVITLNATLSAALPVGFVVAIASKYSDDIIINVSGVRLGTYGYDSQVATATKPATLKMKRKYGTIVLEKYEVDSSSGDLWIATGNLEVL